jgi:hypothetical protein
MRRSPLTLAALIALAAALSIAACSKKETPSEADPKAGDVESGGAEASKAEAGVAEAPDAGPAAGKNRQAALAEKAKAREAARKATKAAREARAAAGAEAASSPEGEPADDPPTEAAQAGTPTPVTPAEAAAARAGTALVSRAEPSAEPSAAAPVTPPPAARAEPSGDEANGVEFVVRDDTPLDLSKLVTLADVQKTMKKTALRETEPLAGSLPARDYNGVRFHAAPNETLGVVVQLWRFSTTIDARRRYDVYSSHYPNAEKTDAVATQGFFAQSGDVLYLGFLDQAKKAVAIVSCSEDACDMKDLYVLARDLQKKL